MKIEIIGYEKRLHEAFVKSYVAAYITQGYIYDLSPEERNLVKNKILFNLDNYKVSVAIDLNDPSKFIGFSIAEHGIIPTLYFIYVKRDYQRLGIGTELFNNTIDVIIPEVQIPMKSPNLNFFFKGLKVKPLVRFYQLLGI